MSTIKFTAEMLEKFPPKLIDEVEGESRKGLCQSYPVIELANLGYYRCAELMPDSEHYRMMDNILEDALKFEWVPVERGVITVTTWVDKS